MFLLSLSASLGKTEQELQVAFASKPTADQVKQKAEQLFTDELRRLGNRGVHAQYSVKRILVYSDESHDWEELLEESQLQPYCTAMVEREQPIVSPSSYALPSPASDASLPPTSERRIFTPLQQAITIPHLKQSISSTSAASLDTVPLMDDADSQLTRGSRTDTTCVIS